MDFLILNKKRYILCYCILDYDDDLIFDLNVSYVEFLIICFTISESVKETYKFRFPILI